MILVSFFEIFDGFWSTKKLPSLLLHVNQDLLGVDSYKLLKLEINQPNLWILEDSHFSALLPVLIREKLFVVIAVIEEDVLRFEVGVGESIGVKEGDG